MSFDAPRQLQNKMTTVISSLQYESMVKSLSSSPTFSPPRPESVDEQHDRIRKLALIQSRSSPGASVFLNALPSSKLFTFSNPEFVLALRIYTGMPLLDMSQIQPGSRCGCSLPLGTDVPVSDSHVMLCRLSGGITLRHNHIRDTFAAMFKAAKLPTSTEPPIGACGDRLDIKVSNFDGQTKPTYFDVTVVNPLQKRLLSQRYSIPLAAASEAASAKVDKYKSDLLVSGNPRFIPLVLETTGGLHRLVKETIEVCCRRFSDNVPEDATWVASSTEQYWLQAISCSLWRGNAQTALTYFKSVLRKQGVQNMLPPASSASIAISL